MVGLRWMFHPLCVCVCVCLLLVGWLLLLCVCFFFVFFLKRLTLPCCISPSLCAAFEEEDHSFAEFTLTRATATSAVGGIEKVRKP
jgi:hypothetical protein